MGTTREVKMPCRSVPPQWYHSGDATGNREREGERERDRDRLRTEKEKEKKERRKERETEIERARRLQKEGRHTWGPQEKQRYHVAAYHHSDITVVTRQATERERERERGIERD